ncbi:MAG: hypothetical protein HY537_14600 [Deltaproteobacteria bacterium]|nr:hypothetical protein [Deltaproteobacteria bacterium]
MLTVYGQCRISLDRGSETEMNSNRIPDRSPHKAFVLIWGAMSLFCLARASFDSRWSGWEFGDAQTMLAVSNWRAEGFRKLHFLWVPQGYASVTALIDRPELSHHSHGSWILPGEGHRIYSHYPSWYAIPYGILGKLGIYNKTIYQWFALSLSLCSVVFFYLFCYRFLGNPISLLAAVLYLTSMGFLEYSDSLANMPVDDFCRFSFLYLWSIPEPLSRRRFLLCALIHFVSSLSSLDSTFYIIVWAFCFRFFFSSKPKTWQCLLLLPIPLIAWSIHFLQNASYLGVHQAIRDWQVLASSRTITGQGMMSAIRFAIEGAWSSIDKAFHLGSGVWVVVCLFLVFNWQERHRYIRLLIGLSLAGIAFGVIFRGRLDDLPYQARQLTPVMVIVLAATILGWFRVQRRLFAQGKRSYYSTLGLGLSGILILFILYHTHFRSFVAWWDFPPCNRIDYKIASNLKLLNKTFPGEKVILQLGRAAPFVQDQDPQDKNPYEGYPQSHPLVEYYAGAPVLVFPNPKSLAGDLTYMWQNRPRDFTPVILYDPRRWSEGEIRTEFQSSQIPLKIVHF